MWVSLWRANHDHQNTQSRLLLANHGGGLPHLCQEVHTMSEVGQPHPLEVGTTPLHTVPMALYKVGNGHSWPLYPGKRPSEIFDSSHRLLHQMDRSQTISHHHSSTSPTVRLERYHMPLWRATHDYNQLWLTVHR